MPTWQTIPSGRRTNRSTWDSRSRFPPDASCPEKGQLAIEDTGSRSHHSRCTNAAHRLSEGRTKCRILRAGLLVFGPIECAVELPRLCGALHSRGRHRAWVREAFGQEWRMTLCMPCTSGPGSRSAGWAGGFARGSKPCNPCASRALRLRASAPFDEIVGQGGVDVEFRAGTDPARPRSRGSESVVAEQRARS